MQKVRHLEYLNDDGVYFLEEVHDVVKLVKMGILISYIFLLSFIEIEQLFGKLLKNSNFWYFQKFSLYQSTNPEEKGHIF